MTKYNHMNYYTMFLKEKCTFDELYYQYRKSPYSLLSALETLEICSEDLEKAYTECQREHPNYKNNRKASYELVKKHVELVKHFSAIASVTKLQKEQKL